MVPISSLWADFTVILLFRAHRLARQGSEVALVCGLLHPHQLPIQLLHLLQGTLQLHEAHRFLGLDRQIYQCMTSVWPVYDQCMTSVWPVHDQCMTSVWPAPDPALPPPLGHSPAPWSPSPPGPRQTNISVYNQCMTSSRSNSSTSEGLMLYMYMDASPLGPRGTNDVHVYGCKPKGLLTTSLIASWA